MAVSYYNNTWPTQPIGRRNQSRTPSLDKSTIYRTAATVARPPEAQNPTEPFFQFTESLRQELKNFFKNTDIDPNNDADVIAVINKKNPSPAVLKALIALTLVSTFDPKSTPPVFGDPLTPSNEDLNGTKRAFLDQIANHIATWSRKNIKEQFRRRLSPDNSTKPKGNARDNFLQHPDTPAFETIAKELQPYLSTDAAEKISGFLSTLNDFRLVRDLAYRAAAENPLIQFTERS